MNDSVESEALVMPSSSGSPTAGRLPVGHDLLVLLLEHPLLDLLVDEEVGVAHLGDAHAAQHLPHDRLDVLVVDLHALESVDLLHLVHQVARQLLLAEHLEDVVRVGRAVHQRLAGLHAVARVHADVLALGDQVLLGQVRALLAVHLGGDDQLALALGVLAERHHAVDLRDDRVILRLARLEELGHAGQTARDVLGLRGLARHLGDDFARADLVAVVDGDDRRPAAGSSCAGCPVLGSVFDVALRVADGDARTGLGVLATR